MVNKIKHHISQLGIEVNVYVSHSHTDIFEIQFLTIEDKNLFLLTCKNNKFRDHPLSNKVLVYDDNSLYYEDTFRMENRHDDD